MRRIFVLFTAVLALMLLSTTVALAQDAEEAEIVYCGDLSEADCALLNASQAALWGLTSGESARVVSVYVGGFPQLASEEPTLAFSNRSMFVTDAATIDQMLALQDVDLEELAEDPDALVEVMLLPLTMDSASTTTVALSPELAAFLSEAIGSDLPGEFTYQTRLIDGVVYINLADFTGLIPQADSLGEWLGIDLMAFMPQVTEKSVAEGEVDFGDVADGLLTPGQAMMIQPYAVMIELGQEEVFSDFLEILPLRDAVIDGQVTAVYRMKMDVPGYVSSPAFTERFAGGASRQEGEGFDIAGTIMQIASSILASNAEAMVLQGLGYEDAYLYAEDMQMGWALAGKSIDVQVQSGNANMNSIEAIPVPSDAFVPPIRLIMGLIETFAGGE